MAGTYGEPGKNPFALKGIAGVLSPVVNAETGVTQIYRQGAALQFQSLGTYNPSTGKFTPDPNAGNLTQNEIKALSSTEGINNIKNAAKTTTIQGVKAGGGTDAEAQAKANKLISPNSASNPGGQPGQGGNSSQDAEKDLNDLKEGTRYKKGQFREDLRYPANLQIQHQDVIEFNMLSYEKRSTSEGNNPLGSFPERSAYTSRIIGKVILPIPGGISDTNSVNWGSDNLYAAQKAATDLANTIITKGAGSGATLLEQQTEQASASSGEIQQGLTALFAQQAVGTTNILARFQGAVQNPNMELLFSGPSLRPFNFTFKLSARGVDDREQIRQIIRFFKQGMAAQRTASQLFLKAPNTFKIRYLHKAKDHPYINYIKECALQSFTVNYTPEGNYMTFADGLMTSYEITMQFQELEPIFNDDYGNLDGKSIDTNIGY
jgi:hypothetical protein